MSTPTRRSGLFMGSISPHVARDPATAINAFMDVAGMPPNETDDSFHVPAIPLGETDDSNWAAQQLDALRGVSALRRLKKSTFGTTGNYMGMPIDIVRSGQHIDPSEINLFFAERAQNGYPILQTISKQRGITTPRMQLGINTIDIAIFSLRTGAADELDAFVEATRREAHTAWEATSGNIFYLIETPCATILANMLRGKESLIRWFAQALEKIICALPKDAAFGFHFCYGDLSNSSIGDLGTLAESLNLYKLIYKPEYSVKMISFVLRYLESKGLVPEFVQIPFAFGKRPPSLKPEDYEEYRHTYIPSGVMVYGGAVHHGLFTEDVCLLYPTFDEIFNQLVGFSNSCGWGRHTAAEMETCVRHMQRVAHC